MKWATIENGPIPPTAVGIEALPVELGSSAVTTMSQQNLPQIRLTEPQRLLCDVIQASDPEKSAEAASQLRDRLGEDAAFDFAARHEVACAIGHHVQHSTDSQDNRWRNAHHEVECRMLAYMQELDVLAEIFAEHAIPVVALKNGGIARGLHSCLGCCPMGDLDLLVRPCDFEKAHRLLVQRRYEFEFRHEGLESDFRKAFLSGSTEYHRKLDGGEKLWIDFQCRPVAGKWIRPDQEPSADELMHRAQPITGCHVRILAPEDNLLQVALHTAKHSYIRAPGLRLHTDVDRVIASQPIDWERFHTMVVHCEVRTPVYFSLALAADLLGAPIPEDALQRLRPRAWKRRLIGRWVQRAGLFEPQESKFGQLSFMTFTALQYDDFVGCWRAIFPDAAWMRNQYPGEGPLPLLHLKRLRKLLWRRFSA